VAGAGIRFAYLKAREGTGFTDPPPRATVLAEVRTFLRTVDDLADHPPWVRRLGDLPPARDWAVWQYDDDGSVPGVGGGVDRNRGTFPIPGR
jgi:lysozyme